MTVTAKAHEAELPAESNALQATVFVPIGKVLPAGGEQVKSWRPHASLALEV
jgi:hypothetical protein